MSGRDPLSGTTPVDSTGAPYPLATITYYIVGTTTPEDVFTTAALTVAHSNPLTLGADGRVPEVFFSQTRMKRLFKDADGNTISGLSWDGIDKSKQRVKSATAPSPTYPGLEWHDTSTGNLKERNAANDAWTDRGAIDGVGNTASVTETLTGTSTTKLVTPDSLAAIWQRGTAITPSGGTVSLPSTGGGIFSIAAGDFSAISTAQGGREVEFIFAGASIITHDGTALILLSGANETTYAGVVKRFRNEAAADASGANWREVSRGAIATQTQMEAGTEIGATVVVGRQHYHPGHPKWWGFVTVSGAVPTLQSSYNLTSITDTGTGILTATIANDLSSVNWAPFVSVQWTATTPGDTQCFTTGIRSGTIAAGTVAFDCYDQAAGQTYADPASWSIFGLGDI